MTTSLAEPQPRDISIEHQPSGHFVIRNCAGAPQIECADFEEALHRAGRFAAREQVQLWYVDADGSQRHLADVFSLRRLWNEYIDLPGLHLTFGQVRRLMAVDDETCASVLDSLIELKFLTRAADGTYARSGDRHTTVAALRMKKAGHTAH
ncbi:MAG TPA: hypothetical protein VFA59_17325 [Vicinamibacterales bacterium]|nr:hypothetical protein [Vicinamibacterales bacterium]